jgi:hypothetical protein
MQRRHEFEESRVNYAVLISAVGVFVSLLVSGCSVLGFVAWAARRYERMLATIERLAEQFAELKEQQARMRSDFPPMREKMDSVNTEFVERLTRVEEQVKGAIPRPAIRPPQMERVTIPRRDREDR